MARRAGKSGSGKPRFPRRRWLPGQSPRIQRPKKGKGSYDRAGERRTVRKEVHDEMSNG